MDTLNKEYFQPHLNQRFTIAWPDGYLEAQLVEVSCCGTAVIEGGREPFSLIFESPKANGLLYQGCYTVSNAALGDNAIFLVAVGEQGDNYQYQAIYN